MSSRSNLPSLSSTKAYAALLAALKGKNLPMPGILSNFILRKFVYDPNNRKITKGELVEVGLLPRNGDYKAFIERLIELGLVHRTWRTYGQKQIPEFSPGHFSFDYVNRLTSETRKLATLEDLEAKADKADLAEKVDKSEFVQLKAEHEALKAQMSTMEPRLAVMERTVQALVNKYLEKNPPHNEERVRELISHMQEGLYCIPSDRKAGNLILLKSYEN